MKLQTLMRALSPTIFRLGGATADWRWFDKKLSVLKATHLQPFVATISSTYNQKSYSFIYCRISVYCLWFLGKYFLCFCHMYAYWHLRLKEPFHSLWNRYVAPVGVQWSL